MELQSRGAMPRFLAAADSAVVVEFAAQAGDEAMTAVLGLEAAIAEDPPVGVVDTTPTLRSLLVEYDPLRVAQGDLVAALRTLAQQRPMPQAPVRHHEVPVVYGGDAGPDLDAVARRLGLARDEVVRLHTGAGYRVGMIGSLPGLPYLLGLPPQLAVPRRAQPRTAVPAGSVAIATQMSCVYPVRGPGGWHLIGRTPIRLFDAALSPPATMSPGDTVRFVATTVDIDRDAMPAATKPQTAPGWNGPALLVVSPGLRTTLQDGGRRGMRRFGVPLGGAADRALLAVANELVGNPADTVALEVTHSGPVLQADSADIRCAVAGECEFAVETGPGWTRLSSGESVIVPRGARLRVGRVLAGLRCYVAVAGGFAIEAQLGSRSTLQRGGLGWARGRPLVAGDRLPVSAQPDGLRDSSSPRHGRVLETTDPIRVVLGPQDDHFTRSGLETFATSTYTVSPASDRVGVRLEGPGIEHRTGMSDIVSDGCIRGSIQVPGDGQPIILGPDCGTTGGYPKVATVIRADLDRIGQLRPGDRVRFAVVSVEDAEDRYRQAGR
jgi:KipI family sensor histidine kinase inhibitor